MIRIIIDNKNSFWGSFLDSEGIPSIESNEKLFNYPFKKNDIVIITSNKIDKKKIYELALNELIIILESKQLNNYNNMIKYQKTIETNFSFKDFSLLRAEDSYQRVNYKKIKLNKGFIYFSHQNLNKLWAASIQGYKTIAIDEKNKYYAIEKLCYVVKSNLRDYAKQLLFDIAKTINQPIIYFWKYPQLYRNIFNIRIDVDPDKNSTEIEALQRIKRTFDIGKNYIDRTSWMINFYRRMPNIDFLKKYIQENYDIQSHAYYHCLFPNKSINFNNIKLAHNLLNKLGVNPVGFNAPEYYWYNHTAEIIEKMGYQYSNSFGYDQLNYPYRPLVRNKLRSYFEIAPSATNYNRFFSALPNKSISNIKKYFIKLFESNYNADIPLLFYIHPQLEGKHSVLLKTIFSYFDNYEDVCPIRLTTFSNWLSQRNNALNNVKISVDNNSIINVFKTNNISLDGLSLAIQYDQKKVKLYSLLNESNQTIDLSKEEKTFDFICNNKIKIGDIIYNPKEKKVNYSKQHLKKIIKNYLLYFNKYSFTKSIK